MATTTADAAPAPDPERLRRISLTQRLLARPAAGALVIVVFVWIVFAVLSLIRNTSPGLPPFLTIPGILNYVGVASQVGIIATAVALLMIAGEFDLSVGSMVGFAGILIGICVTVWGLPVWLSILIAMAVTTCLGVINGLIVVRTGLPSFIVTLATLYIIAGMSSVLTSSVTNITFIRIEPTTIAADPLAAIFNFKLSFVFDGATSDLYVSVVLVDRHRPGRCVHPRADQVGQLDHRRRRLPRGRAQPRRPGRAGEGRAVCRDRVLGVDRGRPPEHAVRIG